MITSRYFALAAVSAALALGACATNPDRVPAAYTSAKGYAFEQCPELAEDMAKADADVAHARGAKQIAQAKGERDAVARAAYNRRCDQPEYHQAAAPTVIVPPAAPIIINNGYGGQASYPQAPSYAPPAPSYYTPSSYAPVGPALASAALSIGGGYRYIGPMPRGYAMPHYAPRMGYGYAPRGGRFMATPAAPHFH